MTDDRFDAFTKTLGKTAPRRTVFKGMLAAALGGLLTRAGGHSAAALRGGCARLGQDCGGANPGCCAGLTCDVDGVCRKPEDATCVEDSDCVSGTVCRPFGAFSFHCQALGGSGEQCVDDTDCANGLPCTAGVCCIANGDGCGADADCCSGVCDPYTATCLAGAGQPCATNSDCVSGICDNYTGICAESCLAEGSPCGEDADCCTGFCDPYTAICASSGPSGEIQVIGNVQGCFGLGCFPAEAAATVVNGVPVSFTSTIPTDFVGTTAGGSLAINGTTGTFGTITLGVASAASISTPFTLLVTFVTPTVASQTFNGVVFGNSSTDPTTGGVTLSFGATVGSGASQTGDFTAGLPGNTQGQITVTALPTALPPGQSTQIPGFIQIT